MGDFVRLDLAGWVGLASHDSSPDEWTRLGPPPERADSVGPWASCTSSRRLVIALIVPRAVS